MIERNTNMYTKQYYVLSGFILSSIMYIMIKHCLIEEVFVHHIALLTFEQYMYCAPVLSWGTDTTTSPRRTCLV